MKLAQHYRYYNSSCSHYTDRFRRYHTMQEQRPIDFTSIIKNRTINRELRDPLRKSHDSATGSDDIQYEMLTHLPTSALSRDERELIFHSHSHSVPFPFVHSHSRSHLYSTVIPIHHQATISIPSYFYSRSPTSKFERT
jgi:hypothetical protein